LEHELRAHVQGQVRFDAMARVLYSTDASIYQIAPIGAVVPQHVDDVRETIAVAAGRGVPVLARGAGTSLAGQAVGHALHIDMSRRMTEVLEVNAEERWARVQPGVVLDALNAALHPYGLMFAPDTATASRCVIGGMIGNNASGAHSLVYGKTVDHVREVRALLADGSEATFGPLDANGLAAKLRAPGREGEIYRTVKALVERHADEVRARYPRIMRRVSGYNLDELLGERPWNLAKLITGSEGTLAVVTEATLDLVPRPEHTALDILHFDSLFAALEIVPNILALEDPAISAIELLDRTILHLSLDNLETARRAGFIQGDPAAVLIVEFSGDTEAELAAKARALEGRLNVHCVRILDPAAQANVWAVRKSGLGLLLGMKGDQKPIAFVEDTAVAPERLPEYIRAFDAIVREHGTTAAYYAHASVGCLHIRPLLDLKRAEDAARMRSISEAISDLVLAFGGAISGEHGDGLSHSCYNEKMFGPVLYQAFRQVKAAFDPYGILNPGKKVDAQPMNANLRTQAGAMDQDTGAMNRAPTERATTFQFAAEGGFTRAIELCNGNGACLKLASGTMCPSYMVTRDEEHSTRGRANALRAAISGVLPPGVLTSARMYAVLDLCLACKACKAECPSNVDMAKLKAEFLAAYHAEHGVPQRDRAFAHIATLNRIGSALAPLSNWVMRSRPARWALQRFVGVDARRQLPRFARPTFRARQRARRRTTKDEVRRIVLYDDTFMRYNYPEVGEAAVAVLEAAGYEVLVVDHPCCGRPMISKGLIKDARNAALGNVAALAAYAEQGVPIVGCEPSCILSFRDEYPDLLDGAQVQALAQASYTFEEFVAQEHLAGRLRLTFAEHGGHALLHGHCHQKALVGTAPARAALKLAGYTVEEVDSGCCGMAGSFGFEAEHYDLSLAIGARRLFPEVKAASDDTVIVAPGVSCRQQIAHATGRQALSTAEAMERAGPMGELSTDSGNGLNG
jgi:FAD/FMN-containing dehydrogenase/Fe-S oxidoreductase